MPYPSPAPQQGENSAVADGPLLGSTLGRPVDELQASLNLIGLKQRPAADGIEQLTSAMLASADANVLRLMARGSADSIARGGPLTDGDRLSLRAMLAQMDAMSSRIREVLGDATSSSSDCRSDSKHAVSSMPTPDPTAAAATPPPSLPAVDGSQQTGEPHVAVGSSSPIAPKKEEDTTTASMATLTEPTPPLTIETAEGTMDLD